MANTTITPNMRLPVPVPGVTPGSVEWAQDVVADMYSIDSHNHSSGQGVQITPDGLSISSDLPMGNNNLTGTRTVRFTSQPTALALASDIGCLYEVGIDLWYNNGSGTAVQVTSGSSVNAGAGSITGLPSGTASVTFAAGTYTFLSATLTPATVATGPLVIGRNAASSKTVTLTPNASQASNFGITLPPALPSATNYATLDSGGNLAFNASGATGTGAVVLTTSPAIVTPTISSPTISTPTFSGTASGTITSGSYTPAYVVSTGSLVSTTVFTTMRINNQVTVYGIVAYTLSAGTFTATVTLPILPTSNFASQIEIVGLGSTINTIGIAASLQRVVATTGAKTGTMSFTYPSGGTSTGQSAVSFTYSCA